jgi:hypothetical protein
MSRRLRRPRHATAVAYLALFVALGGASYAATTLPAGSVGTKQIRAHAVTLSKIAPSAQQALQGQTGPRGGLSGATGLGAVKLHVDSTTASGFGTLTLGHVGAWTVKASCSVSAGTASLKLRAVGPSNTVIDGIEDGGVFSGFGGSSKFVGSDVSFSTASPNGGQNADDLTLFSPTGRSAHISVFKYAGWSGSALRCKVSGTGYSAS